MSEPESPNHVPYQAYRSKRHSRNVSLTSSRPVSFVSEKPVVLVPSSPPASPPPKSLSTAPDVSKPAQEDSIPNGSPTERPLELKLEPESDPPTPELEQVQKPKLDTQPQPELQTAVASSSTASTSLAPPSPTTETRPPPASRKSTTFRRVVPRKAQPQTPTPQRPALAVRQNAPASPSPLSQTTSPAIHDDRPLPPASTGSESQLLDLVMPKPVQPVSPPPRSSSLTASTSSNTATTPSPGITIPAPTFTSQPSSPTRASPGLSIPTPTPTPAKQKSAPKRAPYRPGFQPNGFYRPRTDEFLALRRVARDGAESGVGRKRMERTKLERRLEKLIGLHFPEGKDARPVMKERRSSIFDVSLSDLRSASGSSIWKGVVGGGAKNDIRASEQRITPWQEDSEVTKCPICSSSFHPLSNRKHHCRLCGQIICNLPIKPPVRPSPCSLLFVIDPKTRKIEEVGEGVDYGVRKRTPSNDKKKEEEEEEKFLKGVRICRECRPVLLRQQYLREIASVPTFIRLYDVFVALEKEIEDSLPQFQEMVLSLGQESNQQQSMSKEATATRKRLLDAFAQYDALAKRIRALPGEDGKAVKAGSSQDRVRLAILSRANIFLQKNMFPLQSLPKRSTSKTNTPTTTPPPEAEHALAFDVDSQMAHVLQPLLEQEALLETFVEEATAQRKFEDAKTLRANLKEIRTEIDRVMASSDGAVGKGKNSRR